LRNEAAEPGGPVRARGFRYEVLSLLARGGMAEVLVARDRDLRRRVALKQIGAELKGRPSLVSRFVREVQVTAQLDHPNVVPVYGLEVTPSGSLAYAMKLVEGLTLKDLLDETKGLEREGRVDEAHALPARLEHFLKVCDAVSYAHGKGVLHRDLKPLNLMIGRYHEVYVMDWGIARLVGAADAEPSEGVEEAVDAPSSPESRTRVGTTLGTPAYMSPEQTAGRSEELDARSDQYALGLILQEIVTLERAMPGATTAEVVRNAAHGVKKPLPGGVARELAAIVEKATAKEPAARYASVSALATDLRRFLRGDAVSARPDTPFQSAARALARHRTRALALLLAVVAAAAFVVALLAVRGERRVGAARFHEGRLASLLAATAERSEQIESHFLSLQAYLTGLGTAVSEVLTRPGSAQGIEIYTLDEIKRGRTPPDLVPSRSHHGAVSPEFPVFALAPGVSREAALPTMEKLAALQSYRKRVFFESLASVREAPSEREVSPWEEDAVPLLWSMVGLENGVASVYPGTSRLYDPYDARTRPWYTAALSRSGVVISAPFVDEKSGEVVLAMSRRILAPRGETLGVAAVELTFVYVAKKLLTRVDPSVVESFLLDEKGEVLVRTSSVPLPTGRDAVVLEPFPVSAARAAIARKTPSTQELAWNGKRVVVASYPLQSLGWSYVAVADSARLFER
jgi:serine/threonine-protein kinase